MQDRIRNTLCIQKKVCFSVPAMHSKSDHETEESFPDALALSPGRYAAYRDIAVLAA